MSVFSISDINNAHSLEIYSLGTVSKIHFIKVSLFNCLAKKKLKKRTSNDVLKMKQFNNISSTIKESGKIQNTNAS